MLLLAAGLGLARISLAMFAGSRLRALHITPPPTTDIAFPATAWAGVAWGVPCLLVAG
jgi:hypothetical protein